MLENMTEMQSQAARLQSIREGSGTRQNIQTTQVTNQFHSCTYVIEII